MNKWVIGVLVAIVVLGGGYFLVKGMKHSMAPAVVPVTQATPTPMQEVSPTAATPSASPSTSAMMQEITVTGTEFAFSPSTITVKKGEPVKITFENKGTYPHNFTLSDLGVQTNTIQPGQTATVTFTPTKTGSFTYICTVPGHADRGMKGTLTVQ